LPRGKQKKLKVSQAYRYALLAVLLWSSVATAFKLTLQLISVESLLFYSTLTSLIILFLIILKEGKLNLLFTYPKKTYFKLAILGAINPFIYYITLFKAYSLLPAQEAQAINYTWALMLTYLSAIILKQKITLIDYIASAIAYFGVLIIATHGNLNLNFSSSRGLFFAILSTIFWAFFWIYNVKLNIDSTIAMFINFLSGFLLLSLYILIFNIELNFNIKALFGSIYIGFFEMGITFILWLKALKLSNNNSKIANLIFLSPFLSLIFIHFFVGEKILISTIIGLLLIISALILQQRFKRVNV